MGPITGVIFVFARATAKAAVALEGATVTAKSGRSISVSGLAIWFIVTWHGRLSVSVSVLPI